MTMMVHYIAVLPAGVNVEHLDEGWKERVKHLREFPARDWLGAPFWMRERPNRQLDWGTVVYEITTDDIRKLTESEDFEPPPLSEGERYAVVWVECY